MVPNVHLRIIENIFKWTDVNGEIGVIPVTDKFLNGIEYYIEAADQFGNKGRDGTKDKPYLIHVTEAPTLSDFTLRTSERKKTRPWWKNPWFWVGIVAVSGGVATSRAASGNEDQKGSGTINVE